MSALTDLRNAAYRLVDEPMTAATATKKAVKKVSYVVNDLTKNIDWDPKEHPRDPNTGEFIDKGTSVAKKAAAVTDVKQLGKPIKLNSTVFLKTKYSDGQIVAYKQIGNFKHEIRWNEKKKKFEVWGTGIEGAPLELGVELPKTKAYEHYKTQTGWYTPNVATKNSVFEAAPAEEEELPGYHPALVGKIAGIKTTVKDVDLKNIPTVFEGLPDAYDVFYKGTKIGVVHGDDKKSKGWLAFSPTNASWNVDMTVVSGELTKDEAIIKLRDAFVKAGSPTKPIKKLYELEPYEAAILPKNEFQTWMYENIHPGAWENHPGAYDPAEKKLIYNTAEKHHLGHVLHDLILGGAGDTDLLDENQAFLPDILDFMSTAELSKWMDEKLTPEFWNNLGQGQITLWDEASSHGLTAKINSKTTGLAVPGAFPSGTGKMFGSAPWDGLDVQQEVGVLDKDQFKNWIEYHITPNTWNPDNNYFTDSGRMYVNTKAISLGLEDFLDEKIKQPSVAPSVTPSVVPTSKYDFTGLKSAADIGTPETTLKTGIQHFDNLTKASAYKLSEDMLAKSGKKGWTKEEKAGMYYYGSKTGYQSMNAVLRNDEDRMKLFTDEQLKKAVKESIQQQNAMLPLTESVLLHRGTGAHAFGFKTTDVDFADLKKLEGKEVDELGFLSTSVVPPVGQVSYDYATSKPIKMIIMAPKGTPAVYIPHANNDSSENEMILAAGTRLRLDSIKEATENDKLNYGNAVKHIVIATVVPGSKNPGAGKSPAFAAPAASAAPAVVPSTAPSLPATGLVPTPLATSWQLPGTPLKKLTTTYLQKTAFKPGEVVAWRKLPGSNFAVQQIFWSGGKKKYGIRVSATGGAGNGLGWHDAQYFGKKPTYDLYGKESGWIKPPPGLDITEPPPVLGPPPIAAPSAAPVAPKIPKLSVHDINNQYGTIPPDIINPVESNLLFSTFKKNEAYKSVTGSNITLKSTSADIFRSLAYSTALHNSKKTPDKHLNLLQAVKLIDEKTAVAAKKYQPTATNIHAYENKVLDWLKTNDGKANAQSYIDWAENKVNNPSLGTAPTGTTIGKSLTLKDLKKPTEIGVPDSGAKSFGVISPSEAEDMHMKMLAQHQTLGHYSVSQKNAIKFYTGAGSGIINKNLRQKNTTGSAQITEYILNLQSAMMPVPNSFVIHRAVDDLGSKYATPEQLKTMIGKTFIEDGFFSASVGGGAAFNKKYVLEVDVPKGTAGSYVEVDSSIGGEREFLLAAGTKFKVLSVEPYDYAAEKAKNGMYANMHTYKVKMKVIA